jgi:hypothetical protein
MDGTIYLIGKDGKLEEMSQQPYDKEDILQKYLADYPNLLAGDQIDEAKPKRWLFISREVGVPKEEGGSDIWSLDHLFLDQDGIPTLVEVKRSSDTRSRREVVAQMLDYAANAVVYWPIDRIRACFETTCDEQGIDPIERLRELLGAEESQLIEDFWEKTKTNLQAEKIRIVFVADQIQPEMRRIVEFLNGQMDPAEVLAVEIPQYVGKNQRAVVPRVIGLTAKAEAAKGKRTPKEWNPKSFIEDSKERIQSQYAYQLLIDIHDFAKEKADLPEYGTGKGTGSITFKFKDLRAKSGLVSVFTVYSDGHIQFRFANIRNRIGDKNAEIFNTMLSKIIHNKNWDQNDVRAGKSPTILLEDAFPKKEILESFKSIILEFVNLAKKESKPAHQVK